MSQRLLTSDTPGRDCSDMVYIGGSHDTTPYFVPPGKKGYYASTSVNRNSGLSIKTILVCWWWLEGDGEEGYECFIYFTTLCQWHLFSMKMRVSFYKFKPLTCRIYLVYKHLLSRTSDNRSHSTSTDHADAFQLTVILFNQIGFANIFKSSKLIHEDGIWHVF